MDEIDDIDVDVKQDLHFNGLGADGKYLFAPMSTEELAAVASGQTLELKEKDPAGQSELNYRHRAKGESHFGVKEGISPDKLEETGWGVILASCKPGTPEAAAQQQILEALQPLLDWRKAQATQKKENYYQVFKGERGYRKGESKQKYLARLGVGPGPADPDKGVPYYLLIVGSPQDIPYHVQYQIDVQYAVGRIHFDTLAEYANYARSVVAAEKGGLQLAKEIAFLGVSNANDPATQLSRKHMVGPLADMIEKHQVGADWTVQRYFDEHATRETLEYILNGGTPAPALLYTGSHGMGFKKDDPRQRRHQGALLCQNWPGPVQWQQPISEDFYFSADHLRSDANLLGMIAFNFACYGGGTPQYDEFSKQAFKERKEIAPEAFVAGLHKKMLGLPRGGALAAIGHVERAWGYSFMWGTGQRGASQPQLTVFESAMTALLKGMPVGAAMEYFNERYAELSSDLSGLIEKMEFDESPDHYVLADAWTSNNDARGYAITGDPAVRLNVSKDPGENTREFIEISSFGPGGSGGKSGPATAPTPVAAPTPAAAPAPVATARAAAAPPTRPAATAATAPAATRPAATAPAATALTEPAPDHATSFGFFSSDAKTEGAPAQPSGFQLLIEKVSSTLFTALQDMSRLEVRTYSSSTVNATASQSRDALAQAGQLRAFTRIMIDGDIDVVVPEQDGVVNTELWGLHLELVKQAQAHRAEMIKTLLSLIRG